MMTFRIVPHSIRRDVQVVEMYNNGKLVGTITPAEDAPNLPGSADFSSIRIFSRYIGEIMQAEMHTPGSDAVSIEAVLIMFTGGTKQ
jgi:hypothetical protein